MDDKRLFLNCMKSLQKYVDPINIVLKASNVHVYDRAKQRGLDWVDVYKTFDKFLRTHLCELVYQLHVTPVSTVSHVTDKMTLVIGLYENTIVLRTVYSKGMSYGSTKEKKIIII